MHSNGKNMVMSKVLQPDFWEIVYLVTVGYLYFSNGLINIVFSPAPDLVGFGGIELFSVIANQVQNLCKTLNGLEIMLGISFGIDFNALIHQVIPLCVHSSITSIPRVMVHTVRQRVRSC